MASLDYFDQCGPEDCGMQNRRSNSVKPKCGSNGKLTVDYYGPMADPDSDGIPNSSDPTPFGNR